MSPYRSMDETLADIPPTPKKKRRPFPWDTAGIAGGFVFFIGLIFWMAASTEAQNREIKIKSACEKNEAAVSWEPLGLDQYRVTCETSDGQRSVRIAR